MASLNSDVLDAALVELDDATTIHICSAEPTTFGTLNSLGNKSFGAGGVFGSPGARAPNGRKVSTTAVTDGSVTGTGTATHWAIVDGTRLLATGALSSSQAVTSGNTFTLGSFDIGIPAAA